MLEKFKKHLISGINFFEKNFLLQGIFHQIHMEHPVQYVHKMFMRQYNYICSIRDYESTLVLQYAYFKTPKTRIIACCTIFMIRNTAFGFVLTYTYLHIFLDIFQKQITFVFLLSIAAFNEKLFQVAYNIIIQ